MAVPALSFPAIPVLDVETVLERLPAEARARAAWAKAPIKNALGRLRTEPLTDELVGNVSDEAWKPIASLGRVFWEIVGENQDEWRARFVDDFNQEEAALTTFLEDEDSRDTLRWILGGLRSLMSLALSVPPEHFPGIDEETFVRLSADEEFKPYVRTLVALMAVSEIKKLQGDRQRARELLDVAFLELTKFRAVLRRQGLNLPPFPLETIDERRRGLAESAERLRQTLADDDWRAMDEARLRDLR